MSSEPASNTPDSSESATRPDPFFKLLTEQEAKQLGLQIGNTDMPIQQSTRADLILNVPPGLKLEGTLFDFCRAANIIEFKSENDPLGLREYVLNDLRTNLVFLQRKDTNFDNILNVVVSSRKPDGFITEAKARGIEFVAADAKPWLLRGKVGFQDVVIVVLRDLPLEQRHYLWLVFAPTDSQKWQAFVKQIIAENNSYIIALVKQLRPKEFFMIANDIYAQARAAGLLTPEKEAEAVKDKAEAAEFLLQDLAQTDVATFGEVLGSLTPEQLAAGLAALSPEQRRALLKLLAEQETDPT